MPDQFSCNECLPISHIYSSLIVYCWSTWGKESIVTSGDLCELSKLWLVFSLEGIVIERETWWEQSGLYWGDLMPLHPTHTLLQDMESSNEPVSPFDPYEHIAGLTLHDDSPMKAITDKRSVAPEYKPRLSTSAASARGQLEGHEDSSNASYNGKSHNCTLCCESPEIWTLGCSVRVIRA